MEMLKTKNPKTRSETSWKWEIFTWDMEISRQKWRKVKLGKYLSKVNSLCAAGKSMKKGQELKYNTWGKKSERNSNVVRRKCWKCIENQGQMIARCERKRSKRALNKYEPQTDNIYVDYVQIKFPG